MASNQLIRVSSRFTRSLIATRNFSTRIIHSQNNNPIFLKASTAGFVQFIKLNNRFYATEAKYSQAQLEEKVLDILKNFDRIKENPNKLQVTLQSPLSKELGLDSLDHVEIIVQLEDAFGFEIPDSEYEKLYTPNAIVHYIQKRFAEI